MYTEFLFSLIGGVALFLFGMKLLSEGLMRMAGEGLRNVLKLLTRSPLTGILAGAGITCLIQSSSATTVMTVGLVNAGLLTLREAIGVVMGANIGTTATAWIVSFLATFKIGRYALPLFGIGFFIYATGRSRRKRSLGQVILGFALLFLGISVMKEGFSPLGASENVKAALVYFSRYPVLGVIAGVTLTILLQSSSATIAIVQLLAFQGSLSFPAAIALVLGDNIGTTVTAQLASVGTNISARRAALAHTLFNVIGAAYMLIFLYLGLLTRGLDSLIPGPVTRENIMFHIAFFHSLFNIFNTFVVFYPLTNFLQSLCERIIPGEVPMVGAAPVFLERHLLDTPPLAMEQARKEIARMGRLAIEALDFGVKRFCGGSVEDGERAYRREEATDSLQREITQYLIDLSQRNLSLDESRELPVLIHSVNDVERIGDHAVNLVELADQREKQKLKLPEAMWGEIGSAVEQVRKMGDATMTAFGGEDTEAARRALEHEETLNQLQAEMRRRYIWRLGQKVLDLPAGIIFINTIDNLEKVGDHLANIAQAVLGGLRWGAKADKEVSLKRST